MGRSKVRVRRLVELLLLLVLLLVHLRLRWLLVLVGSGAAAVPDALHVHHGAGWLLGEAMVAR